MHFCAIHLDDAPRSPEAEEVYVVVPGGSKTAMAVPLDALAQFLPLLERAVGSASRPRCPACAVEIPKLALCPARHANGPILGKPGPRPHDAAV
jgi:hypothetical protein